MYVCLKANKRIYLFFKWKKLLSTFEGFLAGLLIDEGNFFLCLRILEKNAVDSRVLRQSLAKLVELWDN